MFSMCDRLLLLLFCIVYFFFALSIKITIGISLVAAFHITPSVSTSFSSNLLFTTNRGAQFVKL